MVRIRHYLLFYTGLASHQDDIIYFLTIRSMWLSLKDITRNCSLAVTQLKLRVFVFSTLLL